MRRSASTRNTPTPNATARIRVMFGTDGTCWASTWRSGSAIVIITPIIKAMQIRKVSRRLLVSCAPTRSPIIIIDRSAPSVKSPMPRISKGVPTAKRMSVPSGSGAIVRCRISTTTLIGSTEEIDSLILSHRFLFIIASFYQRFRIYKLSIPERGNRGN